jgi:predicted MFS family arabinose efflux permease
VADTGYCFTFIGVLIVLIQGGAIRPLRKRFGEAQLILTGVFLMALGFWFFGHAPTIWILMLGPILPITIGNALNNPSLRSLVSQMTSSERQGSALGISASFDSLARATGPAFAGELYRHYGPSSPYIAAAAIMTIAFLFALTQYRRLAAPTAAAAVATTLAGTPAE